MEKSGHIHGVALEGGASMAGIPLEDARLRSLLEGVDAIIWEGQASPRRFTYVSPQAARLGYALEDWLNRDDFWPGIIAADDRDAALAYSQAEIAAGRSHHLQYRVQTADGRVLWMHETVVVQQHDDHEMPGESRRGETRLYGVMVDISSLKENEQRIVHLASHDDLTDLPNRALLQDRASQAMALADRNGLMAGLLLIDIDRFEQINNSLGLEGGDQVLRILGERLHGSVREVDTVARQGGDEFVVLLTAITRMQEISEVARKLLQLIAAPLTVDGQTLHLGASIGISVFPKDGGDVQALMKNADAALHRAKEGGRNRFEFYTEIMNVAAARRAKLESHFWQALEKGEFVLHYQPLADIDSARIVGVEALVRWQHPELGLLPPHEFVPLAEDTGFIVQLGNWVLETACHQAIAWQTMGLPKMRIAVNLSPRQCMLQDMVSIVARVLRETGLDPVLLELELTESLLMQNADESLAVLQQLRKLGVCVAIDDFGTGYSSLNFLARFPVTTVKIDRTFIRDVTTTPHIATLVRAIISIAHEMKLRVVTEGVETEGQLNFLAERHCDEMQGYFLSHPVTADECTEFLRGFHGFQLQAALPEPPERTLLIVDDEANILTSLKRLLRLDGYRILTASSGMQGLELLAVNQVGVIISDQRMPEMTGVEFLRRVKELHPDTVRIVLSGYTDLQSITDAINAGAIYKFLTKPWEDDQLREQVHEAFQRYELKQENTRLTRELEHANHKLSEINRSLELRVEEKIREIRNNVSILQVSQEVLEYLPTAVIGVDDDGLIVMANHQADALLANGDGPLLGCEAESRLPNALFACLGNASEAAQRVNLPDGRNLRVLSHRMGETCKSRGTILVFSLFDPDRQ